MVDINGALLVSDFSYVLEMTLSKNQILQTRTSLLETVMVGSPTIFLWKKILRNMKQMMKHFFFAKSFSFPEIADSERNFLGVQN